MKVAIVGTGISGVTLALRLQQLGIETTLFAERSPDELRQSRIDNLVARFPATRERERLLGVAHWNEVEPSLARGIDVSVTGTPVRFSGHVDEPSQAVDFRVYLSQLMEDYSERGGDLQVETLPASEPELRASTADHDVVLVAAGRAAPVARELFPIRFDRTPYQAPQRRLLGGLCTGITHPRPAVSFNIVPGTGEIFCQPMLTASGVVSSFLIEAIPGGVFEPITHIDPDDSVTLASALRTLLIAHAPVLAERIEPAGIQLLGPRHTLAGAITPTVRQGFARLTDGRLALAIGDAWILNDPVLGQGANIGSHCAWVLAHALAAEPDLDDTFAERIEHELWAFAGPITALTNAFLQPPPPHMLDLLAAATANQLVADAFAAAFADPVKLAHTLLRADTTAAFIRSRCSPVPA